MLHSACMLSRGTLLSKPRQALSLAQDYTESMLFRAALFALLTALPALSASYHFAAIWDGTKVWRDACITVDSGKIESIGPCSTGAADLTRYTAIPGLIDVHTHMTYILQNPVARAARAAAVLFLAQDPLRKPLEARVTTVRDLGSSGYTDIAMRDLINAGRLTGPRMFV